MAEEYFNVVYRLYVDAIRSDPAMAYRPSASPMEKEDLMDYKVVTILDDGSVEEQYCATSTDVENHAVYMIRKGQATQSKVVSITIANLWVKN